jgi:hypothetical protein
LWFVIGDGKTSSPSNEGSGKEFCPLDRFYSVYDCLLFLLFSSLFCEVIYLFFLPDERNNKCQSFDGNGKYILSFEQNLCYVITYLI